MKKIFTSVIALLFAGSLSAQTNSITLTQSSYSSVNISTDTFGAFKAPFPPIAPGTDQYWDLASGIYDNIKYYSQQFTGSNTAFPSATFYEATRLHKMGSLDSVKFNSQRWSGITATGFQRMGESTDRQAIWLGQIGAAVNDSLVVLQQNAAYPTPYDLIKFPATYNSTWNSSFDVTFNMELTLSGQGLNKAPFVYKSHTDYMFTCPGWGTARVLLFDGTYGEDKVLMERIKGTTTDSFFLNGVPAPANVLTTLGLTQGKVSNNNFDELFRPNEVNALALYLYGADNTFTNIQSTEVHVQRLPFAASVKSVSADGSMALYPNPVNAARVVHIKLNTAANGNYSYRVTNITGQESASGTIAANGQNELSVVLPAAVTNGVYWLSLTDNKGKITVAPFRLAE
jgi:hypothetical protein